MKRFFMRDNKDQGEEFLAALLSAGYERIYEEAPESGYPKKTDKLYQADFLMMDSDYTYKASPEWEQYLSPEALQRHPMFIYGHTPYSWFLWDGILQPKPTLCNFVVSNGAKVAMQLYGYPYPVEVIGFPYTEVKPFQSTTGTKLLFAPAHPVHDGKFPQPDGLQRIRKAVHKIRQNLKYFESVTVRYHGTLAGCGLDELQGSNVIFDNINVYNTKNIRDNALAAIAKADLVISESTFGYLSIATGKPTLFYGYDDTKMPNSREGWVKNYKLYKHIFHFPLCFENMSIHQILEIREHPNGLIEQWKRLNIGENFDAEKFIVLVGDYLESFQYA